MGSEWSFQYQVLFYYLVSKIGLNTLYLFVHLQDYALGQNLTNRMPLYVYPPEKIPLEATFSAMRNHYEGTALDMGGETFPDVGAGDASSPYRAHPLTWTSDGSTYLHERPVGTQQTGWNFVAQSRSWVPRELAALMWFGVDDSSTTVRSLFHL